MPTQTQTALTQAHIDKALNYKAYRGLIDELLEQNRATGDYQPEGIDIIHYTKMNVQRMNRWDKTTKILPELLKTIEGISQKWIWLVLTEGWCGDAAQNIPALVKMAAQNQNIQIKFLLRDENLEIMDTYLTDGGRSIPKLICLKQETLEEIGTWGPRPTEVQQMVNDYKENPTGTYQEFTEKLHKWYANDKTHSLQKDFLKLINTWT